MGAKKRVANIFDTNISENCLKNTPKNSSLYVILGLILAQIKNQHKSHRTHRITERCLLCCRQWRSDSIQTMENLSR